MKQTYPPAKDIPWWAKSDLERADRVALLRYARDGHADYATDLALTHMGHEKLWELVHVGWESVTPYVMQGGFDVSEEPVYVSRLTAAGERELTGLEAEPRRPNGRSAKQ